MKTAPLRRGCETQEDFFSAQPARSRLLADGATERKLPRPPSDCFETGRRSQTQSSVQALRGRDSKWMSGSRSKRNHRREARTRAEAPKTFIHALLLSASGELLPS